jgi:ABC-type cobalamin/Fe3+-siderophores transport system ATPase subunit
MVTRIMSAGVAPANEPHHHVLKVTDLTVSYREVRALEQVSFETECGRSIALVGPNGAGKSTLLKTLAGLLKPETGSVLWRGKQLVQSSHELAYLPQRGEIDWNFPITVRGLVEMGRFPNLGWWKRYSKHDEEIVERALAAMQLEALEGPSDQRPFRRSTATRLRRSRPGARSTCVLLDEPFTGLDKPAQEIWPPCSKSW